MNITISAPHCTVPGPVVRRTRERIQKLERYESRILAATLTFEVDHGEHVVDAQLSVSTGPAIRARGAGETFRAALDVLTDRLSRQLRRHNDRRRDHQATKLSETLSPAGGV